MQQNIINNQPWPTELAEHANLANKTGSNLTAPLILPTYLQQLQITMKQLTKTMISQVNNH